MNDDDRQNALADVSELAQMLHALRGLSGEVESLLADAMKVAHAVGLTQVLIADAAALSPGRVSQIVKDGEVSTPWEQLSERVHTLREWPGDALRPYRASFAGHMAMPPYRRRRSAGADGQ